MMGVFDFVSQRLPHHVGTAAVLAGAATLTLLCGLVRSRGAFLRHVPGTLYVAAAAAAVGLLGGPEFAEPRRYAVMAAALLLAADWLLRWREAMRSPRRLRRRRASGARICSRHGRRRRCCSCRG